jgi:hypothetical protein
LYRAYGYGSQMALQKTGYGEAVTKLLATVMWLGSRWLDSAFN